MVIAMSPQEDARGLPSPSNHEPAGPTLFIRLHDCEGACCGALRNAVGGGTAYGHKAVASWGWRPSAAHRLASIEVDQRIPIAVVQHYAAVLLVLCHDCLHEAAPATVVDLCDLHKALLAKGRHPALHREGLPIGLPHDERGAKDVALLGRRRCPGPRGLPKERGHWCQLAQDRMPRSARADVACCASIPLLPLVLRRLYPWGPRLDLLIGRPAQEEERG
mmetsp:Transcript_130537/g.279002  ORF Transcript_130537/g.279002 Transcript_130537/m.279002 type:complete len:220 (-) Transcript_130537:533-1192(-)